MFFWKQRHETSLTQAVINNNIDAVRKLKDQNDQRQAKNDLGFTGIDLACYLGRKECLELLDPMPPKKFKVLLQNESKEREIGEDELLRTFGVHYAPYLRFPDYTTFVRLIKGTRSEENVDFPRGCEAPVSIRWINQRIGYGLFSNKYFEKGAVIGEYTGSIKHVYFFQYQNPYILLYPKNKGFFGRYVIDAEHIGNELRFINHSYEPNLTLKIANENGLLHTLFVANQPIPRGTQLLWNYGEDYWASKKEPPDRVLNIFSDNIATFVIFYPLTNE